MDDHVSAVYQGLRGQVMWHGVRVPKAVLQELCTNGLRQRVFDVEARDDLLADLRAAATTEMGTEVISELLESEPSPLDWEVGEALAESFLEVSYNAVWPWNSARDRRTPRASLPGADLVGFVVEPDGAALLFGEVKTSSDSDTPPGVVYGRTGLIHQIDNLAARRDLHFALLRWLQPRCTDPDHRELFEQAAKKFVSSRGRDFRLVGCLMRDTEPNELDLLNRAISLSGRLQAPTNAKLIAWYLPESASVWPTMVEVSDDD